MFDDVRDGNITEPYSGIYDILEGIRYVYESVAPTLGPYGYNVLIDKKEYRKPRVTNDGVSIVRELKHEDPVINAGIKLVREVAETAQDNSGDGTTTAVILTYAIIEKLVEHSEPGVDNRLNTGDPNVIKILDEVLEVILDKLDEATIKLDDFDKVKDIATVASGSEHIGNLIQDAYNMLGTNTAITVEPGHSKQTTIEVIRGFQIDRGYLTPYLNDTGMNKAVLDNPYILVTNHSMIDINTIFNLFNQISQQGRSVLIIADDVGGDALKTLIMNNMKQKIRCAIVKSPDVGSVRQDMLRDIAALTGATFISKEEGRLLNNITINDLGQAERVEVLEDTTIITGGHSDDERVNILKSEISEKLDDAEIDKDVLIRRLANLNEGIGVIKVGGVTELELNETIERVEDALRATRLAIEEGVVPGGGSFLFNIAYDMAIVSDDPIRDTIYQLCANALRYPIYQLLENRGVEDPNELLEDIVYCDDMMGVDLDTCEIVDLAEKGILDPSAVVRGSLEAAFSIAKIAWSTSNIIVDLEEDEPTTMLMVPPQQSQI